MDGSTAFTIHITMANPPILHPHKHTRTDSGFMHIAFMAT